MDKSCSLLASLKDKLAEEEKSCFSPLACLSHNRIRRTKEHQKGYRQSFAKDTDRILHSKAYT
ncbi:MAG: phosphohydrolase, partial [Candidatus Electrothrix sp. ATG2]|nr:phosphohydrolase [Candidatus Electrothrix sp. ATG2]